VKRNKYLLLPLFLLLLGSLACNASLPVSEPTALPTATRQPIVTLPVEGQSTSSVPLSEATVPRIPVDEARAAFDAGEAIIVDVRSVEAYEDQHAEGAINIPLGYFETDIANVPLEKDQWIITYCT
jgi:hypothetical protein